MFSDLLDEEFVEVLHLRLRLCDVLSLESEQLCDSLGVIVLHTLVDVDGLRVDLVGRVVRHGLNVHAALRRRHEHGTVVSAIKKDRQVQLAIEVDTLVNQNLNDEQHAKANAQSDTAHARWLEASVGRHTTAVGSAQS